MRIKSIKIIFFILTLTMLSASASVLSSKVNSLQTDLNKAHKAIEASVLQMRRLDYDSLSEIIKSVETNLTEAIRLMETNDEDEAENLLKTASASLALIEPMLYESLKIETRGMWVDNFTIDRFYSREDIAKHLDELKAINVNIIFPDVYGNGAAIYPSKVVPQQKRFQTFFNGQDILKIIIEEAHLREIEVHPLVRIFALHNGAEHFIDDKLTWLDRTSTGSFTLSNGYYWLCPGYPDVREYNITFLKELATNYDIDGIHLDYIRFDADFGYNAFVRELFKSFYGIDPVDIQSDRLKEIFTVFKAQFVNKFVERAFNEIKAINSKILVSAAVASPYSWGKKDLGQDWLNWVLNRHINFLTPMSYRSNVEQYSSLVKSEINTIEGKTYIYTGLGIYLYNDKVLGGQIQAGRDVKMSGQAVFSTANMKPWHYEMLKNGPWREPAIPTFRDPAYAAKALLEDSVQRLTEFGPLLPIEVTLLDEYIGLLQDFVTRLTSLSLRPWDSRDLRESNTSEFDQLSPLIDDLIAFSKRINRDSVKDNLTPNLFANRLGNDIDCVRSLLEPLLYTATPYEYISSK